MVQRQSTGCAEVVQRCMRCRVKCRGGTEAQGTEVAQSSKVQVQEVQVEVQRCRGAVVQRCRGAGAGAGAEVQQRCSRGALVMILGVEVQRY